MPTRAVLTVTDSIPAFLDGYEGISNRRINQAHVANLASDTEGWKHDQIVLWNAPDGRLLILGGQHRITALRTYIFPETGVGKYDLPALIYTTKDVPRGTKVRAFLLKVIDTNNKGRANSRANAAEVDQNIPWNACSLPHGLTFGDSGGRSRKLHIEHVILADSIAREYLAAGYFKRPDWVKAHAEDKDEALINQAILYASWWDDNVSSKVHGNNAYIGANMNKPVVLSLILALVRDPANELPANPAHLLRANRKHRTFMEMPTKLLAQGLVGIVKGNNPATIWEKVLEPVNRMKQQTGRLRVNGTERF